MECLNRRDYDREACTEYFQAYRDCKKAWVRRPVDIRPSPLSPTPPVSSRSDGAKVQGQERGKEDVLMLSSILPLTIAAHRSSM
jgi:hypothetical protein